MRLIVNEINKALRFLWKIRRIKESIIIIIRKYDKVFEFQVFEDELRNEIVVLIFEIM